MSFINSVMSFFLIVERNIFYFFFNIVLNSNSNIFNINDINNVNNGKNGNGKNGIDVKKFMKDKNSNDDLNSHLNSQKKSFAVISPVTSNNDLTIELHDTDLYDSPV